MEKNVMRRVLEIVWVMIILFSNSSQAQPGSDFDISSVACSALRPIDLGLELRGEHFEEDPIPCFLLEVPAPGWLHLMTSISLPSTAEPEVIPLIQSCPEATGFLPGDFLSRNQPFNIQRPGSFGFCLRSEDPRDALTEFRILAVLREHGDSADAASWSRQSSGNAADKGGDPKEEEVEPPSQGGTFVFPGRIPIDPWDDHGNFRGLATPIEVPSVFAGNLESLWDVDSDLFVFQVANTTKVEISMVATEPVRFLLEDHRGSKLRGNAAAPSDGIRWFKNLEPGRFYLRIEGLPGSHAHYQIEVEKHDLSKSWSELPVNN